jgi:plastocyanin
VRRSRSYIFVLVAFLLVCSMPAASEARSREAQPSAHARLKAHSARKRAAKRLCRILHCKHKPKRRVSAPATPGARADAVSPAPATTTPVPAGTPAAGVAQPQAVQVIAREWSLTPSRYRLAPGSVTVEFNLMFAEDPHDLWLVRGGTAAAHFQESLPGTVDWKEVDLGRGTYTLFCALPGHQANGMQATLIVG